LKTARKHIYTDFLDLIGEERTIDLPGFDSGHDVERFRDKTQQFLKAHEKDPVIHKLRWNEPLTGEDLDRLERIMAEAGTESVGQWRKVRSNGELGYSCVGWWDGIARRPNGLLLDFSMERGWLQTKFSSSI
jgi:type I site-specific restriction endonuclease